MKKLILIIASLLSANSISQAEDSIINCDQISEKSGRNILLILGTDWCGGCVKLKKEINSLELKDYLLCIVDAEERKDISNKYSVKSYPTSIILRNNSVVSKKIGYSKKEYSKWLDENRKKPDFSCQCGPDCKCGPDCNKECKPKQKVCDCGCLEVCKCSWFSFCGCYWSWLLGK